MFDAVEAALGPIACLVNNAGIAPGYGAFADLELADMEQGLGGQPHRCVPVAREAVRRMALSRGGSGGSIVNVSSKAAVIGGPGEWIHYAASKGGLETLTAGLSKEVAADGIRVNNVRPGLIAGDFGPWGPSGPCRTDADGVPMRRAGEPRRDRRSDRVAGVRRRVVRHGSGDRRHRRPLTAGSVDAGTFSTMNAGANSPSLSELLDVCVAAARAAGAVLIDGLSRDKQVCSRASGPRSSRGPTSPRRPRSSASSASTFPTHAILGEEGDGGGPDTSYTWIVDPSTARRTTRPASRSRARRSA